MNVFSEATCRELTRKPMKVTEAKLCRLHGVDPASLEMQTVRCVNLDQLDALCRGALTRGVTHFAVYDPHTEDVYAVNSEGYDYARYLGRFSGKDARAIVAAAECKAEAKHSKACQTFRGGGLFDGCPACEASRPTPVAEFSGFEPMCPSVRMAYEGCEGEADIAWVADPNEKCPWQFDLVVDDNGLQAHFVSVADVSASWGIDMADRAIAQAIGAKVADAIIGLGDEAPKLTFKLDDALRAFGLVRL